MRSLRFPRLDERGVALPIALFGLVAVSLLVTAALLTASTELALSRAHQDGTRGLYAADAALEQFVERRAAFGDPAMRFLDGEFGIDLDEESFRIAVSGLFQRIDSLPDGSLARRETYSLLSRRADDRGRAVGALLDVVRRGSVFEGFNVDAGLTLGTNTTISGSADVSDGSDGGCLAGGADYAIRYSSDARLHRQGGGHTISGETAQDTRSAIELMAHVLGGKSLDDLSPIADIRFGAMFDRDRFSGTPSSTNGDADYNWGCPVDLVGASCAARNPDYYPLVIIDAEGGQVQINGGHGQGVLVIRNGRIHVNGNFLFQGILLVEGSLKINGTPRIEGAVVVMGDETVIDSTESEASGNALIRYDACHIEAAQAALATPNFDEAPQEIVSPTYAWFEVTR